MLKIGQIVEHSKSPHIVVFINDCRAILLPAEDRDLNDPNLMIQETAGVNVSPNSELPHLGWFAGQVRARQNVARSQMKVPVQDYGPAPVPPPRKKLRRGKPVMPEVPDDGPSLPPPDNNLPDPMPVLPVSDHNLPDKMVFYVDLEAAEATVMAIAATNASVVKLQQLLDSSSD